MLKCYFIKRKLYDYLENGLSDIDKIKVRGHLESCDRCGERLTQIKSVIELAAKKTAPQPNGEFWHNFKLDLDRGLNRMLVPPLTFSARLAQGFRPAFTFALALMFVLATGVYMNRIYRARPTAITQGDDLVAQIEALDELAEGSGLDLFNDTFDEMDFYYQFEQL